MIPISGGEGDQLISIADTSMQMQYESKGKGGLGLYADIGYWKSFANPRFFHFWEVGLSYRQYKGSEDANGSATTRIDSSGVVSSNTNYYNWSNSYNDQAVSLVAKRSCTCILKSNTRRIDSPVCDIPM